MLSPTDRPLPLPAFAQSLLSGAIEEARTERDVVAASRRGAHGRSGAAAPAKRAATTDVLVDGGGEAAAVAAEGQQTRLLLLCRVLVPATGPGAEGRSPTKLPSTATAEPTHILPLHLIHYGISTTPVSAEGAQPTVPTLPVKSSATEKSSPAPQHEAAQKEPSRKGGGKGSSHRRTSKSVAEGAEPEPEQAILAAVRGTREYAHYTGCQKATADVLREASSVFGASIEGMRAQLTPARAQALANDIRREAELQGLIADAKAELARLKKVNRELANDLQSTYQ